MLVPGIKQNRAMPLCRSAAALSLPEPQQRLPRQEREQRQAVSIEGVPSRSAGLRAVFPRIQYSDHLDQATPS